ncbi:unnamed protein product [Absidia cylindrospora]
MVEVASSLVGNYVQVTVKNGARFQGTLSETSIITHGHLEIILKDACNIRHGLKKNDLVFSARRETLTINHGDLKNIALVKSMQGKNVFKINQEIGDNRARQERHHQQWQPTTEVLEETSFADLELSHNGGGMSTSTDTASWNHEFTANEKQFGLKEEPHVTNLDRSVPNSKDRERKAIILANEIQQSSSSNAHALEERGCIFPNETRDEGNRFVTVNINSTNNINNTTNGNTSHRSCKSSIQTYNSGKLHHNNKYQSHQHYQSNILDQKNNDTTHSFNDFARMEKEIMDMNNTKSTITPHSDNYSKTSDELQNNGQNTYLSTSNSKKINRKNYHHRKWIRHDLNVNSNKTTNYLRNSDKSDSTANSSDMESNNINQSFKNKNESSPRPPFQFNIMATEFIPFGGMHTVHHGEIKSEGTTSTVSSSSTPRTPGTRKSKLGLVNEMFTAPFNKKGHIAPNHTEPLWPYGDTPYRNHSDFSFADIDWLMSQYQSLHHILYGYHPLTFPPYPVLPYVPHYYHQQYKANPRNRPIRMYPVTAININNNIGKLQ